MEKMAMKKFKPPKMFARPVSAADLEKKVMRRIYLREYRDALGRMLVKDDAGRFTVKPGLDKQEARLLKKIAVSVSRNTGFVQKGKLVFIGAAAAVIVCFNVFFKDMLVELAAEAGLEAVFQARADIRDLRFQILAGRIAFTHLEVADKTKPMQNLFALGATEVRIDVVELLKSNVVIDDVMCRDIRWGTPRVFSGALPGARPPAVEEVPAEEADPLAFLSDAESLGADILEKEKDKLLSLKTADRLAAEYPAKIETWEKTAGEARPELESVSASVKAASDIKVETIKNAADAAEALAAVDKAVKAVAGFKKKLETTHENFNRDRAAFEADRKRLDREMKADFERIAALIGNPLGTGGRLASALLDRLLGRYLGDMAGYARLALDSAASLKPAADRPEKEKPEAAPGPVERRYGFIRFPGAGTPKFWLKKAETSVTTPEGLTLSGKLTDATGEPDMIGKPVVFSFASKSGDLALNAAGTLDGRADAADRLRAAVALSGQPVTLDEGAPFLNLKKIRTVADGRIEFAVAPDGRTAGAITLTLRRNEFTKGTKPTPITDLVFEALTALKEIRVSGTYRAPETGPLELSLDSNLDEALGVVAGKVAAKGVAEGKALLKKEFDKLLDEKLGAQAELVKRFADLDQLFKGDVSSLGDADQLLAKKKDEITKTMRTKGLSGLKLPIKL